MHGLGQDAPIDISNDAGKSCFLFSTISSHQRRFLSQRELLPDWCKMGGEKISNFFSSHFTPIRRKNLLAVFLLFGFPQSLIGSHSFGLILGRGHDLVAREEEGLHKEILRRQMMDAVQGMAMVDVAEHHQVMLRVYEIVE